MADMNLTSSKKRLQVDLTPMVDLGFILISFFLFTTTLSSPQAMRLVMPDKPGKDSSNAAAVATLTVYPDATSVHYAEGKPGERPLQEAFLHGSPSLRDEILSMQGRLAHDGGLGKQSLTVLIKPGKDLPYGQLIGVLDEMLICGVHKYMIVQ
jgi:biopolymer transport protein ExbD